MFWKHPCPVWTHVAVGKCHALDLRQLRVFTPQGFDLKAVLTSLSEMCSVRGNAGTTIRIQQPFPGGDFHPKPPACDCLSPPPGLHDRSCTSQYRWDSFCLLSSLRSALETGHVVQSVDRLPRAFPVILLQIPVVDGHENASVSFSRSRIRSHWEGHWEGGRCVMIETASVQRGGSGHVPTGRCVCPASHRRRPCDASDRIHESNPTLSKASPCEETFGCLLLGTIIKTQTLTTKTYKNIQKTYTWG